MTPEERARLERLEQLVGMLASRSVVILAGDVNGPSNATVLSEIASLAGSGTLLVAVDNGGNIISGGAPSTGGPTYLSQDATAIASAFTNVDFNLATPQFLDRAMVIEVRCIGATKEGTGNLVSSTFAFGKATVNNKNGILSFGAASLGLPVVAANPHNTADSHVPVYETVTTDANLQGGGGQPFQIDCQLPGAGIFRARVNSSAGINCPVTVFLTIYSKVAP